MRTQTEEITVLHVDDEATFAELTATVLERTDERFRVITTTDVDEGLDILATEPVDCVISDYEMANQDGLEFLEIVRETDELLPFILYTGRGSEDVASEAISAGVTDYLQKETGTSQYTVLANRITNAVESMRAQRERQRQLDAIETAQEGVSILDDDHFVYVNRAYCDLYGYEPDELLGEHYELLYLDEDLPTVEREITPALENEGRWHGTTTGLRADGSTFVEDHTLSTTANGEVVCTVRDITEQVERETQLEALNESMQRLINAESREDVAEIGVETAKTVIGLEANAIHLADDDTGALVPVAISEKVHEIIGEPPTFSPGEGIAWRVYESGETLAIDDVHDDEDILNPDSPVESELHVPLGEDGILIATSTEATTFDEHEMLLAEILAGNLTAAFAQVDRTEQLREREAELTRQNNQLEQFASILSHDLRNPLNVAEGRLELLRETGDDEHAAAIERAHTRMRTMIDDLLTLAREGEHVADPEIIAIDDIVKGCWSTVETDGASLRLACGSDCPRIRADPGRLKQLIENLVANAVEHGVPSDSAESDGGGDGDPDGHVVITVGLLDDETGLYIEDTGPGVPENERESVFEAGYSTSATGTGFGLAIVAEIVEAHGWDIRLVEGADGGARFEITGIEFEE